MPLLLVILFAALLGLRQGLRSSQTTETDIINAYASRYLEARRDAGTGMGAGLTDCVAYPGQEERIWLIVSCGPSPFDAARHYEYTIGRRGQLLRTRGPMDWGRGEI